VQTTARFGQLQTLGSSGLTVAGAPSIVAFQAHAGVPSSAQWNGGIQMELPWAVALDIAYAGQHSWNGSQSYPLNSIDLSAAFLPSTQDPTTAPSSTPGASSFASTSPDLLRAYQGYGTIGQSVFNSWRTYHSIQISFQRRFQHGIAFGFNDSIGLIDRQNSPVRLEHVNGLVQVRADQAQADALLGNNNPTRHTMNGNFVWTLPTLKSTSGPARAIGLVVNDWQLSGIWSATTSSAYTVGFNYQNGGANVNLTGSPDFAPRVRIVGSTGGGCNNADIYRQFTTAAFQGPLPGSVGLESGNSYLRGCFLNTLDLAIARNIRLPHAQTIQLRADLFNAPNTAQITGRNTTMNLSSPSDPVTITNPTFDPITGLLNNGVNLTSTGAVSPDRSLPKNAGFGTVNAYQNPRTVQVQIRFSF
jgi:hypothetical protein